MKTAREMETFYLEQIEPLGEHAARVLALRCATLDHAAETYRAELDAANNRLSELEGALDVIAQALSHGPERLIEAARAIERE
jgi:hypothetical protein